MSAREITIYTCRCGGTPKFQRATENGGHGITDTLIWIECDCGMATVRVLVGRGGAPVAMAKCAEIWNANRMIVA